LQSDGHQCKRCQRSAKARQDLTDDRRIGDRCEHQRQNQRNQWWECRDAACHLAHRCTAARTEAGDRDAQRAEHEIGPELVDQQPDRHIAGAVERLDHRHADEGCIGEAGGENQCSDRRRGEVQLPTDQPDRRGYADEHQPRHQDREEQLAVELDAVNLQQRERRQRYVDNETIDRQVGVVGDPARGT
jgi:hypothetical protein